MLIEEIDAIGAKPLEHTFDSELDVLRAAVEPRTPLTRLEIVFQPNFDVITTLFRKGAMPSPRIRSTSWTIRLGRVEKVMPRSNAIRMMLIISGRLGTVV